MPIVATITRTGAGVRFFSQSASNAPGTGGSAYALYKSDGTSMGGFRSVGEAIAFFNRAYGESRIYRWDSRFTRDGIEQWVCIGSPLDPREVFQKAPARPPAFSPESFLVQWIEPDYVEGSFRSSGGAILQNSVSDLSGSGNRVIGSSFVTLDSNESFLGRKVVELRGSSLIPAAGGTLVLEAPFTLMMTAQSNGSGTKVIGSSSASSVSWWVGERNGNWALSYDGAVLESSVPSSQVSVLAVLAFDDHLEFLIDGELIGQVPKVFSDDEPYVLGRSDALATVYLASLFVADGSPDRSKIERAERWMGERWRPVGASSEVPDFNPLQLAGLGVYLDIQSLPDGNAPTLDTVGNTIDPSAAGNPISQVLDGKIDFGGTTGIFWDEPLLSSYDGPFTLFVRFKPAEIGNSVALGGATTGLLMDTSTVDYGASNLTYGYTPEWQTVILVRDSADVYVRKNGVEEDRVTTGFVTPTDATPLGLGIGEGLGDIECAAFGIYNRALTAEEIARLESYLATIERVINYGGVTFDGVDQSMLAPAVPAYSVFNNENDSFITLECWVKTSTSSNGLLLGSNVSQASGGVMAEIIGTGFIRLRVKNGGQEYRVDANQRPINDGVLHHVVVAYLRAGLGRGSRFYVDGETANGIAWVNSLGSNPLPTGRSFSVADYNGGGLPFDGQIVHARMYDAELSQAQAQTLYNGGVPYAVDAINDPTGGALIASFSMADADPVTDTVTDLSSTSNDGTLLNDPVIDPGDA